MRKNSHTVINVAAINANGVKGHGRGRHVAGNLQTWNGCVGGHN